MHLNSLTDGRKIDTSTQNGENKGWWQEMTCYNCLPCTSDLCPRISLSRTMNLHLMDAFMTPVFYMDTQEYGWCVGEVS